MLQTFGRDEIVEAERRLKHTLVVWDPKMPPSQTLPLVFTRRLGKGEGG